MARRRTQNHTCAPAACATLPPGPFRPSRIRLQLPPDPRRYAFMFNELAASVRSLAGVSGGGPRHRFLRGLETGTQRNFWRCDQLSNPFQRCANITAIRAKTRYGRNSSNDSHRGHGGLAMKKFLLGSVALAAMVAGP